MRRTSIDAYHQIKEDGTLGRLQWAVYHHLFTYGPLTTRQVHQGVRTIARDVGIVSTRLTELSEMGVVASIGEVVCETTGKTVLLWDVTEGLPKERPKKQSKVQALQQRVAELELENRRLKSRIQELEEVANPENVVTL